MMAEVGNSDTNDSILPPRGRVNAVCREWLVHEDGCLAYRLQEEEFDAKYGLNRHNRRTVREDIPVVKVVQTEEEERLQIEQMQHIQRQRQLADEDEEMARQVMEDMEREEEEQKRQLAQKDEELARQMQEKEEKRLERKRREKELARQRRDLERQLQYTSEEAQITLESYRRTSGPGDMSSLERALTGIGVEKEGALREDGRVEDVGDFSDFYIPPDDSMPGEQKKELQEAQDEEIARLLQEQEHKRGAVPNRDKLREIEAKDEELARVIQEQEKYKARKARHKLKQMSERQRQQTSEHALAMRSRSLPEPPRDHPDEDPHETGELDLSAPEHSSYMPTHTFERQQRLHQERLTSDLAYGARAPPVGQTRSYEAEHYNADAYDQQQQGYPAHDDGASLQISLTQERQKSRDNERLRKLESERQRMYEERQRSYDLQHDSPSSSRERQRSHHDPQNSPSTRSRDRQRSHNSHSSNHGRQRSYDFPHQSPSSSRDRHAGNDVQHGSPSSTRNRQRSGSSSQERRQNRRGSPAYNGSPHTPSPELSRRHQKPGVGVDVSRQLSVHSEHEPSSPAPPGYYHRDETTRSATQDSLSSQLSQPVSANNIMAAIDPTYNPNNPRTEPSPTHSISTLPNRGLTTPPLPLTVGSGGEDGYCDIAETPPGFGPVQGQKRSTLKKKERSQSSNKRSSCKQQ